MLARLLGLMARPILPACRSPTRLAPPPRGALVSSSTLELRARDLPDPVRRLPDPVQVKQEILPMSLGTFTIHAHASLLLNAARPILKAGVS
jgi:hypothetical protein